MPTLNSIRARLTVSFMLIVGAVVIAVCMVMVWYSFFTAGRTVDTLIQTTRRSAEQAVADPETPSSLRAWLHAHSVEMDAADMAAVVLGPDGAVLQKTQP